MLKETREQLGMTADQVAERAGELGERRLSASKITRIERDQWQRPKIEDIETLLDIYRVDAPAERAEYLKLAREARQRGWWSAYADVLGTGVLPGLEPGASRIRAVGIGLIPGLLQTEDYATEVIRGGGITDPDEIARRVEARMLRQRILTQSDPPTYWAIIDEAALRKRVSAAQLQHLIDVQRPTLRIQILPDSAGPHAASSGGFTVLDFEADSGLVYTESPIGHHVDSEPDELEAWDLVYQYVSAAALSIPDSEAMLHDMIQSL